MLETKREIFGVIFLIEPAFDKCQKKKCYMSHGRTNKNK